MEKKRKWQFALILGVVALTVYNILPTLFFYVQPLKAPVTEQQAQNVAAEISTRVNRMEEASIQWLSSYCSLLGIDPQMVQSKSPGLISLTFVKNEDAQRLRKFLPRAGALIPNFSSQLALSGSSENPKEVLVQRRIDLQLSPDLFQYVSKSSESYKELIRDRAGSIVKSLLENESLATDVLSSQVANVLMIEKLYKNSPEFSVRLSSYLFPADSAENLRTSFAELRDSIKQQKASLEKSELADFDKKEMKLVSAEAFIKKHPGLFNGKGVSSYTVSDHVELTHPLFSELSINWEKDAVNLQLHADVLTLLTKGTAEEKQIVEQLMIDEAAKIARKTNEKIARNAQGYTLPFHDSEGLTGVLTFKLDVAAQKIANSAVQTLKKQWNPLHPDLSTMPILRADEYEALPVQDRTLCLVIAAPAVDKHVYNSGFQNQSIYVVTKGFGHILRAYGEKADSPLALEFQNDFRKLAELLGAHGYAGYPLQDDYVFEQRNFLSSILTATREDFKVYGSNSTAFLEFTDLEHRLVVQNKIETDIHEDLIKWNDEYRASTVSLNPAVRYDVPAPSQSVFWSNLNLTWRKILRGDERKVLRWGLDLSGGKSVQIELRDQSNKVVTSDEDIKQGINELFDRVNKMGVSDVSIRQVGNHIALDFPGSQALSASELIRASSMYFHIVNEKFGSQNPSLAQISDRFLQEIWNEAVVTGRKNAEQIQAIAYNHLHGEVISDSAKTLLESGLKFASPNAEISKDGTLSKVAVFKDEQAHGAIHPLLIVFHRPALEGSSLENIRANYDSSKGNYLSFEVKRSAQEALYSWTNQYSKDKVAGTSLGNFSRGNGWRMAVVLNDSVISAPVLQMAIKDSASISGSFSQREVNQLASDLKAGSLTFTPHILFEKNISPELGKSDRMKGIGATAVALVLVIASMIAYYRFAGLVASVAVLFNLLILWATLQNLGATLSLAGIAGIILTVGMAVDANVLVFERIKEEFAATGRIGTAISVGYEKAFTAIVDSNITTILAALILLNFDAGPIKAFAVCMIIGIASSMFTALFMTRFYFNGWLKNPKNTKLTMANWIRPSKFNFLKYSKAAFAFATAVTLIGGTLLYTNRSTLFGMDFTGGYAIPIELAGDLSETPSQDVAKALIKAGASSQDFQVRQHNPASQVQILFGTGMEQSGKPFFGMPLETQSDSVQFSFEKNPRINWVVQSLHNGGIEVAPATLKTLDSNWTAISGQMSESMRNNAILGLLIAFAGIFIYIAVRFEYKFATAATLCLLHDVLVTVGLMGILHALKVPVQIDLNTIAALMTIVGYSLNDTIIIFDRIREDTASSRGKSMRDIVNTALNTTLSRTSITSGTTLLVLLALLFLGGSSIFSFSLVMVIGVVFGTLSSWFIACPLMLFFHKKEESKEKALQLS